MSYSTIKTPPPATRPDPVSLDRLVLRAGGGGGRGLGHVGRCLALAEAWRRGGGDTVVVVDQAAEVRTRAMAGRTPVRLAPLPSQPWPDQPWLVQDGYDLDAAEALASGVAIGRRVRIDDRARSGDLGAAVIVDQDPTVDATTYDGRPAGSTLLLGPRYALLRSRSRTDRDRAARPQRLLVALGGDPDPAAVALVGQSVARLVERADLQVDVIGGGDHPSLRSDARVRIHGFVGDVDPLLARADVALVAAGTMTWELCRQGLPSVLVATVDNQAPVVRAAASAGVALAPEPTTDGLSEAVLSLVHDEQLRLSIAATGRRLVDGRGAARVVAAIRSREVDLRPVATQDSARLLTWANDPGTRAGSFDPQPIAPCEHDEWLAAQRQDPDSSLYLAGDGIDPWGLVRFRIEDGVAAMGLTVAPERRGTGLAAPLIRAGVRRLLADRAEVATIDAWARPENQRSITAFEQAGFELLADGDRVHLRAERSDGW